VPTYVSYEIESKIFRTDAVKIINLTTKCVWKLSTSTQLRATWHTDSLDMVFLPSTGAWRYNCCIYGGTSLKYYGYTLVGLHDTDSNFTFLKYRLWKKIRMMVWLWSVKNITEGGIYIYIENY
jgi:hypothetical protein